MNCACKGIGHAPHIEAKDETLAAITDFCQRLSRIEAAAVTL